MSDDQAVETAVEPMKKKARPRPRPKVRKVRWAYAWQVPAIVIATVLIAVGLVVVRAGNRQPDLVPALDRVDELLEAEDLAGAEAIQRRIEEFAPSAPELVQGRFLGGVADALVLGGLRSTEVDERIVNLYERAASLGYELTPTQRVRRASSLVDLGRDDEALALLDVAGASREDALAVRARMIRRLAERALAEPRMAGEAAIRAIDAFRADPSISLDDAAWAVATVARLRLELGRTDEAIDRLLVEMRRLDAVGTPSDDAAAELYALLGAGYLDVGRPEVASGHLQRALGLLETGSVRRAPVEAALGRIALESGEPAEAIERFDIALSIDPFSDEALVTRLMRAEALASLGADDRSIEDYNAVATGLEAGARSPGPDAFVRSLLDRHSESIAVGAHRRAVNFLVIALRTETGRQSPDVLLRMGAAHRLLAEAIIADHAPAGTDHRTLPVDAVPRAERREANSHFIQAADLFLRLSRRLEQGADEREWSDALWTSAESYDLGGQSERAAEAYEEYLEARGDDDLRRAEVRFRLARIRHAAGDLAKAELLYEELIRTHPASEFAASSHVPLAQCLVALGRTGDARLRLEDVVEGRVGLEPDAVEYREALIALGRLLYEEGDWLEAVRRLDAALRRYPDDERIDETRFQLADAHRGLARTEDERLEDPALTPSQRDGIRRTRDDHLTAARRGFEQVVQGLDAVADRSDPLRSEYLRLAHLYRADTAAELGELEEAITLYEVVERRYRHESVSLLALVRIVNACHRLGDDDRAMKAHRRAEIRLAQLPSESFDDPSSIFDRETWARWLENTPIGGRRVATQTPPGDERP